MSLSTVSGLGKKMKTVLVGWQHIAIVKCPILSVFDCIVGLGENIEFDALGCIPSGTRSVCVNWNKGNWLNWLRIGSAEFSLIMQLIDLIKI